MSPGPYKGLARTPHPIAGILEGASASPTHPPEPHPREGRGLLSLKNQGLFLEWDSWAAMALSSIPKMPLGIRSGKIELCVR